jgi:hypothetical protein
MLHFPDIAGNLVKRQILYWAFQITFKGSAAK